MVYKTLRETLDCYRESQNPAKRRKYSTIGGSDTQSETITDPQSTVSRNFSSRILPNIRDSSVKNLQPPSAFTDTIRFKISSNKIVQDIRDEMKILNRQESLEFSASANARVQDSNVNGLKMGIDTPRHVVGNPESAQFTYKQVHMLCDRMLKKRKDEIRGMYDEVLTASLSEQYDTFVKFTFDQIKTRYEAVQRYLS